MDAIGPYRRVRELERRGGAVVYTGEAAEGDAVAIWTTRAASRYIPDEVEAFRGRLAGDARVAATLSHPNLVTVRGSGRDGDLDYVVTEFLPGRTLDSHAPTLPDSLRILGAVAEALDYVHGRGIVHDWLLPRAIILGDDGSVKLGELGLARILYPDPLAAGPPSLWPAVPPVEYLSPEHLRYEYPRTGRSDQFSLGAIAYELLSSRKAFGGDNLQTRVMKVVTTEPEPVAPGVDPILRKAMAKDPAGRFGTCTEFVAELYRATRT